MKALKMVAKVMLALAAGIMFPILIWVALGAALGKTRVVKAIGKVMLALAGGILFPILIWVALGVAIYEKARTRRAQTAAAPTVGEIIQDAKAEYQQAKAKPILIVDDEEVMRVSLREWLTDMGYEVDTAEAGEDALKAIEVKGYDFAVLDLKLPGKDGIQVLREARARRPQFKGIIMTAFPSAQSADEAKKEGAVDYLQKPLDLNELEKLIRNVLGPVQLQIKPAGTEEKVASAVETRVAKR